MKIGYGTLTAALLLGTCAAGDPPKGVDASRMAKYQTLQPVQIYVNRKPLAAKGNRFSVGICDKTADNCTFNVTVDGSCNVQLDPQYIGLRGDGEFTLVYKLATSGAKFAAKAIDWSDTGGLRPPPGSSVNGDGTLLTVTIPNKANTLRRLAYTLGVENPAGHPCPRLDPGVIPDL
jgi:hypothetical protein